MIKDERALNVLLQQDSSFHLRNNMKTHTNNSKIIGSLPYACNLHII